MDDSSHQPSSSAPSSSGPVAAPPPVRRPRRSGTSPPAPVYREPQPAIEEIEKIEEIVDESPAREDEPEGDSAEEADGEETDGRWQVRGWARNSSAMIVSTVVHMAVIIVLSLLVIEPKLVNDVQEIVSQMLEEVPLEQELVKIELENQLTEVTERTEQVFSSSPIVGTVGASGPQGMVSAPTMDSALLEQVVNSNVNVEGISIDVPSSRKLIVEAPDGMVGDARAVVDSYQEALDRITQEILWMLDKGKVLVIWNFDQSQSMEDDQKEIRDRIEHVYNQLGLVSKHNEDALETAVTSYGQAFAVHTRKPTHSRDEIRAAIDEVPTDPSGLEMMCSSVREAIQIHRDYAQGSRRQMALILVTDESGDQMNNSAMLEQAIAMAKSARCKIYVLGREAVFGYPYVHIRWVHPQTNHTHWIRIDRGPETAFVEQLQTDGFHRRYDAHPSGFGPYECSRMGRETGGIFFMLPSLESNLVHGQKRNYDMEAPYFPDLRSKLENKADIERSPMRTMLEKVIYELNPYNPAVQPQIEMQMHFPREYEAFVRSARGAQGKAAAYITYLGLRETTVGKMEAQRKQEASPRWQANYDLLYAQLVAYQARMYEYGVCLEDFIKDPQVVPLTRKPNLTHVGWEIRTRQALREPQKVQPYIDRATEMFKAIIANHPSTPWAARAEFELKRGFGVELIPDYDPPYPTPSGNIIPVPKL
jgi:hypothetical protein